MKPVICAVLTTLATATTASSQPMWDVADRWLCTLQAQIVLDIPAKSATYRDTKGTYVIDFKAGTRTSTFIDQVADITFRSYTPGPWGNTTVIHNDWGNGPYPQMIVENDGVYWAASSSGEDGTGSDVWYVMYHCEPEGKSS